ncbi:hypothetical protein [Alteromonas sp. C1M14]|uniref:hypothetical protein n=1 Tax=Alteromonas sp. C1M14 TaxID=2841567 RepID=UPI001C081139|nr:hypothetical protein [Alteromonas sp. C1M14]MBU2977289.1 hypothetical protein [Alteromonas sp. C1M14]
MQVNTALPCPLDKQDEANVNGGSTTGGEVSLPFNATFRLPAYYTQALGETGGSYPDESLF